MVDPWVREDRERLLFSNQCAQDSSCGLDNIHVVSGAPATDPPAARPCPELTVFCAEPVRMNPGPTGAGS